MTQLVTRVPEELVDQLDNLIEDGVVKSRSSAVRQALENFIEQEHRQAIGQAIVEGYKKIPQTEEEAAWIKASTQELVDEEPW